MYTSLDYNRAFQNLIRCKTDANTDRSLFEGFDSGSYMLPYGFAGDYKEVLTGENLFRRYGTVLTNVSDGYLQTVASTADAQVVSEEVAYPEDSDAFTKLTFSAYKIAALAKLNHSFVTDAHFDVDKYLKSDFARRFGRAEENVLLNGTGVDEPTGVLTSADVGVTAAGGTAITGDEVIALYFSVKPEYRKNSVWLMNDATALALRSLKDSTGNYLWCGTDDTILGKPVVISNFMPDMAAGNAAVAVGDLSYFWLLERKPLPVRILTEKYMVSGMIGFAAHERIDGVLVRNEAVKVLKMAGADGNE